MTLGWCGCLRPSVPPSTKITAPSPVFRLVHQALPARNRKQAAQLSRNLFGRSHVEDTKLTAL